MFLFLMQKSNLFHIIVKIKIMMVPPHKIDIRQVLDMNRLDTFHLFVCLFVCWLVGWFYQLFCFASICWNTKTLIETFYSQSNECIYSAFRSKGFFVFWENDMDWISNFLALCFKMKACLIKQKKHEVFNLLFLNTRL